MPAKDAFHDVVRNALIKDGWTITHDPLTIKVDRQKVYVDIGAERTLAAEKQGRKIAVEVKTLLADSIIAEMEKALGQYFLYRYLIMKREPEREIWLAVPESALKVLIQGEEIRTMFNDFDVHILTFDPKQETLKQWIATLNIEE